MGDFEPREGEKGHVHVVGAEEEVPPGRGVAVDAASVFVEDGAVGAGFAGLGRRAGGRAEEDVVVVVCCGDGKAEGVEERVDGPGRGEKPEEGQDFVDGGEEHGTGLGWWKVGDGMQVD